MKWIINKKIEKILKFIDIDLNLSGRYDSELARSNLNILLYKDNFKLVTIDIKLTEEEKEDELMKFFVIVMFNRISFYTDFPKKEDTIEDFGTLKIIKNYLYHQINRKPPHSQSYEIKI